MMIDTTIDKSIDMDQREMTLAEQVSEALTFLASDHAAMSERIHTIAFRFQVYTDALDDELAQLADLRRRLEALEVERQDG